MREKIEGMVWPRAAARYVARTEARSWRGMKAAARRGGTWRVERRARVIAGLRWAPEMVEPQAAREDIVKAVTAKARAGGQVDAATVETWMKMKVARNSKMRTGGERGGPATRGSG